MIFERRPRRSRKARARRRREGAVYAEFIIAFPPVLIFFLCLLQLSMIFVAKLSVQHAATRAARAAVVVIPGDPQHYDDEPVNNLTTGFLGGLLGGPAPFGLSLGEGRLDAIRAAAWMPLIPISPSVTWVGDRASVIRSYEAGYSQILTRGVYARSATAVTFYEEPEGTDMIWEFEPRQAITTRVTHLYYCSIPLASAILCDDLLTTIFESWDGARELVYTHFPIATGVFVFDGGRFIVVRAEATLPNQGAGYEYE